MQLAKALRSPFVGRREELQRLLVAVARSPSAVIVEGEAGVGKTRLIEELAVARSTLVLTGHCQSQAEPFPLMPVVEALRLAEEQVAGAHLSPVVGALRPLIPEWRGWLPEQIDADDPVTGRHLLFRALREVFVSLGSTLLVLEDVQWVDRQTTEFLKFLARRPPDELSVVATYRAEGIAETEFTRTYLSDFPAAAHVDRIAVRPLPWREAAALVEAVLGGSDVSEDLCALVYEHTAGLPLAVEEFVRLLHERSELVVTNRGWDRLSGRAVDVPARLRDAILARASHLRPGSLPRLRTLAVLGRPVPLSVLRAADITEQPWPPNCLDEAIVGGLVHESDGKMSFRHTLAQQAIYEDIPPALRCELHRRAAFALSDYHGVPAIEIARHHERGGDVVASIHFAQRAADQAVAVHDHAAACRILLSLLRHEWLPDESRLEIATALAEAARPGGAAAEALAALAPILERCPLQQEDRGRLRLRVGVLLHHLGRLEEACRQFEWSVEDLGREPEAIRALCALAWPLRHRVTVTQHLAWLLDAEGRAADETSAKDSSLTRLFVAFDGAVVRLAFGDPMARTTLEGLECPPSGAARRIAARAYGNAAELATYLGDCAAAASFLATHEDLSRPGGGAEEELRQVPRLLLNYRRGEWTGLEDAARQCHHHDRFGQDAMLARTLADSTRLAATGTPQAAADLGCSVRDAWDVGLLPAALLGTEALAMWHLWRDNPAKAIELASDGLEHVATKGMWVWAGPVVLVTAEGLVADGRPAEAKSFALRVSRQLHTRHAPEATAACAAALALATAAAGPPSGREAQMTGAVGGWLELSRPLDAALTQVAWARVRRTARPPDASVQMAGAIAQLETVGAHWYARLARQDLRRWGGEPVVPHRGGRRAYGEQLSPREVEIVRLAAAGRTNREIGGVLCLSTRTVENHLARAFRKLGVRSRRSLLATSGETPQN